MTISPNKYVACTYDLYVGSESERELMEQATSEKPLEYIHGMGMMLPAFEKNLFGLSAGDKFDFELSVEDAYGNRVEDAVVELPKDMFMNEKNEFDSSVVFEGNIVPMRDSEGNVLQGNVMEVREDVVVMDFNHPLAGETLHFIGEVKNVHEATAEEIEGFFGSHGGGCGCGCGDEDSSDEGCGGGCGGGCCH
ncbi:FKBP-type peptidyl-prolyl cis-trans isomerase [Porphyromonas pogonae]|uniref:FKBP-type peptidyl-prolyl cis-trans isomerase n=1 Tax=Porphyromonas pogonae TaxID=867595 RepID=UPI002E7866D7|nr:FKBP-type peptidyl-prolyl cis-trans isomerase [Porphyromonas pogonae]